MKAQLFPSLLFSDRLLLTGEQIITRPLLHMCSQGADILKITVLIDVDS